jgi:uncharacterized protein (DUF486 family)
MTFAWYAHLKDMDSKPWIVAVLVSYGIAFFEYIFQVPGNRFGYETLSLEQLKITQEVISLTVFVPFAIYYMNQPISVNYIYASMCILGAVYFIFKA